jgi:hypothetical protein
MTTQLAWGKVVSSQFTDKVFEIQSDFDWSSEHPSWLMSCMAFESGESFSPSIRNAAGSGATGLIQFMPSTAKFLKTTTDRLAAMSAVQQLEYVKLYFKPYAHRIDTLSDMYMAILMPKYIGQSENAEIFSGGIAYRQNSGLDKNRDGTVTKAEATAKVKAKLEKCLTERYVLNL